MQFDCTEPDAATDLTDPCFFLNDLALERAVLGVALAVADGASASPLCGMLAGAPPATQPAQYARTQTPTSSTSIPTVVMGHTWTRSEQW